VALRKELKRLTDERHYLRFQLRQRAERNSRSPTDRDYSALSQEVVAMRSELTVLLQSDKALHREELQEEAKVLYQEWLRLQDCALDQEVALNDAKKELDDDTSATYDRQARQIAELTDKLEKYEHANTKLAQKIKRMRTGKEGVAVTDREEIVRKIEDVEKKTLDIEERIRNAKENHQKVMSSVRASLRAAGVAQEDAA
jgi:hypothetical protein